MTALRALSVVPFLFFGLHDPAAASTWQKVIAGKYESIEIDKTRIARTAEGVTAWSRIAFDREAQDAGGAYNIIQAQILYDCTGRRFTTVRRVYFNGDTLVREDAVARQRSNKIEVGSIDERLFNVACRAAASRETGVPEASADQALTAVLPGRQDERPAAMHADMRTLAGDPATPRLMPVAETAPVTPTEKPKLIVLPPIDKAAADQAAASAGQKPATASAAPSAAKAGTHPAARSAATAPAHATTAPATPVAAPSFTPPPGAALESPADRRLRELHYATSGPRKAMKKKRIEALPASNMQENPAAHMHVHWSYEGEGGPGNWARLRDDYAICAAGKRQSPIDIREGIKVNLESIKFDYKPTHFRIIDTGHTVQVNVGEGLGMTITGKHYELIQFHFHKPSEERINGRAYDMVVHLVHRNDEGQLAVVAVLLEKGSEHPLIQTLWNNLPLEQNMDVAPEDVIDLNTLLPENRGYWTYMGSLTTPPCSEGVLWMVLKQPVQLSPEQVSIFGRLYRNNARPVQPLNDRLIKESR
jgi:carbonic anhydrase